MSATGNIADECKRSLLFNNFDQDVIFGMHINTYRMQKSSSRKPFQYYFQRGHRVLEV